MCLKTRCVRIHNFTVIIVHTQANKHLEMSNYMDVFIYFLFLLNISTYVTIELMGEFRGFYLQKSISNKENKRKVSNCQSLKTKANLSQTTTTRALQTGKTPRTAACPHCRRHVLVFKIKVTPWSCRSYSISMAPLNIKKNIKF